MYQLFVVEVDRKEGKRERERAREKKKTEERMSRRARKKLSDEAGALELCNL